MAIYTSYYAGQIIGEAISISLYPPKNWQGKHLPLFSPTAELLDWWKRSPKDLESQAEYKSKFTQILSSREKLIQLWVSKQKTNRVDITLCCFEKTGDFCHRYQVGAEVIAVHLPELWGNEIVRKDHKQKLILTNGHKVKHPSMLSTDAQRLFYRCHSSGYPVVCLGVAPPRQRLFCGYYQVSLHGEDLGVWGELGLLGLLSGILSDFDRPRLVPSLKNITKVTSELNPVVPSTVELTHQDSTSPSLITKLRKLERGELTKVQAWCESIKHLMFPSVSQYADGRHELHLRRFVTLESAKSGKKSQVGFIPTETYPGAEAIEELGENLLPDFHQGLVLFYPQGTQIKVHRDSPAYAIGAAQINVTGQAKFSISGCQDIRRMESYSLDEGDCISFNNKQPHAIEPVKTARWCICFFYLKPEYLNKEEFHQLSLI